MKMLYKTKDGSVFVDEKSARDHEDGLFTTWLRSDPVVPVKELLNLLDGSEDNEWYDTEVTICICFLRRYYEKT